MKVFSIVLFWCICSFATSQQALHDYVDEWSNTSNIQYANVGVAVHEVESGEELMSYRGDRMLVPASSLKVLTTILTVDQLGRDYRYSTKVGYTGRLLSDGTLEGDIVVIGSGDPSLGKDRIDGVKSLYQLLEYILQSITKAGVTCIDGDVVVDESIFDAFPVAPTWQWNDLGNYYAGGAWGLNVNENEYNIWFDSNYKVGSSTRLLYTDPTIPDLVLQNEVQVDSANSGDNAYVFGGPYDFTKRIVGTVPQSKHKFKIKGAIPDPPLFFARALRSKLYSNKIRCGDAKTNVKKRTKAKDIKEIVTIESPSLMTLAKYANAFSINQYCEAFLKTIAHEQYGKGSGSYGIRTIRELLIKQGLNLDQLHMEDGSGLSVRNLVAPSLLSEFISLYSKKKGIEVMKKLLPKAGAQGTVRTFMTANKAKGRVWVKSGSMEHIISYTGICQVRSGKWVSFSIIVNGYNGPYRKMKEKCALLVDAIYQKN